MIKPLTSLRFIFASMVFLSHYVVDGTPLFSEGYIGVSFFFILSGFVLAYSYKDRLLNKATTKTAFFVARFARIYPLHFATFLAYFGLAVLAASLISWEIVLANVTLTQSWIPLQTYYFSFNAPSWSISDEMFFYLMFPLLISFFYRAKLLVKWSITATLCLFYMIALFLMRETSNVAHAFAYINPLFRLLDFVVGIGLYQIWQRTKESRRLEWWLSDIWRATVLEVASIALLVVMIVLSSNLPQVVRYSCYYWLPMGLIIYIFAISNTTNKKGGGALSRFLSMKFAILLGEISFGFYMIHILVMTIANLILGKLGIVLPTTIHFALITTMILAGSTMSFYWFETPINRWIKKLYKRKQDAAKIGI